MITFPVGAHLTDPIACLTDADGDGYSHRLWSTCFADQAFSDGRVQFIGENKDDRSGWSVSSAGDVDGDGLGDIILGVNYYDNWNGKAYLILGASLGSTSEVDVSSADYSLGRTIKINPDHRCLLLEMEMEMDSMIY